MVVNSFSILFLSGADKIRRFHYFKKVRKLVRKFIYASLFRQKQAVKKTKKNKDKYIAREIYNTIPAATLHIHYGNSHD